QQYSISESMIACVPRQAVSNGPGCRMRLPCVQALRHPQQIGWIHRLVQQARWISIRNRGTLVLCNLGTQTHSFPIEPAVRILLASRENLALQGDSASLPPDTVAVVGR